MAELKCVHCGGNRFEPGSLQAHYGVYFRPDRAKFLRLKSGCSVKARVCLECGAIEIVADPSEVLDLIS